MGIFTGAQKAYIDGIYTKLRTLIGGAVGTVTSVSMTAPTGLSVSGSPITSSGTLAVTFTSGYSIPTNASQANWSAAYGWGNHASAGYLTAESYTGTVTSVALSLPAIFSVSGSPVTGAGTLAASLATQSANAVWAGPTSGGAAAPTFRALVAGDIPDLSGTYKTTRAGLPREIWIDAAAMVPRTSNGPATATVELSTNKQNFDSLDFDASAAEYAQFKLSVPEQWGAGTVKAKFYWTAASGSGSVVWAVQGVACSDDDPMDASWGTAVTVTDTLLSANDCHIATTGAITIGGSPAVADLIYVQVYRDATNGSDTLAVDARLLGIKLQYVESSTEASAW